MTSASRSTFMVATFRNAACNRALIIAYIHAVRLMGSFASLFASLLNAFDGIVHDARANDQKYNPSNHRPNIHTLNGSNAMEAFQC